MNNSNKLRIVFILVCVILTVQITWWIIFNIQQNSVILNQKTQDIQLRLALANSSLISHNDSLKFNLNGLIFNGQIYKINENYIDNLKQDFSRKNTMFISESLFVLLLLLLGIFIVYRSLRLELKMTTQQKNFLLSITHELKTPISSIKLLLQTLLKKDVPKEKSEQFIKDTIGEVERLNRLVSNIILTTKAETVYLPENSTRINLHSFISDFISSYDINDRTQISFRIDPTYDVKMNSDDLYIILSNLISNAMKYNAESECLINISTEINENRIELIVSDNGIGIPDSEKQHIYKRFYRVGSEETRTNNGTGIGLYIVKLILNKYKSNIVCKDNKPRGTQFIISLKKDS